MNPQFYGAQMVQYIGEGVRVTTAVPNQASVGTSNDVLLETGDYILMENSDKIAKE